MELVYFFFFVHLLDDDLFELFPIIFFLLNKIFNLIIIILDFIFQYFQSLKNTNIQSIIEYSFPTSSKFSANEFFNICFSFCTTCNFFVKSFFLHNHCRHNRIWAKQNHFPPHKSTNRSLTNHHTFPNHSFRGYHHRFILLEKFIIPRRTKFIDIH